MEGINAEFEILRKLCETATVYALPSTGGTARILADKYPQEVRSFDSEGEEHVREFRRRVRKQEPIDRQLLQASFLVDRGDDDIVVISYANVAARIVDDNVSQL